MSVPQSRLLICLLTSSLLSATTLADSVVINTTIDENNVDNKSCSLRESIHYLNAKNIKKAINDEEIAVISGISTVLINQLTNTQAELTLERGKTTPDLGKIATLETQIAQLKQIIDAGTSSLNRKLIETKESLATEKSKTTPNAALVANYEASIKQLEASIKAKEEEKTAKEKEMKDYRAKGLFGCVSSSEGSNDNIILKNLLTPYLVDSPLTINLSLSISAEEVIQSENTDLSTVVGLENYLLNPVIQASANHALFIIDDGLNNDHDNNPATSERRIAVSFTDIDFVGCNALCATNGGIILNKEALTISKSILSKGQANRGGAIYNAEKATLVLKQTVFRNNQAVDGAAIFSEYNSLSLESSLLNLNKANNNNAVVTIASDISTFLAGNVIPHVENVTISGNEGAAISSYGNLAINNSTIVNNTIGVSLNNNPPAIFNTIIAGNTIADCHAIAAIPVDTKIYFTNNVSVTNKGCPTSSANHGNIFISNTGDEKLIADPVGENQDCPPPPALGLLCPLAENGGLTKTHKPRLLTSYTKLADSLIVNKGFYYIFANNGFPCSTTDQRGLIRKNDENRCDIGAVELQSGLSTPTQGDDIVFGQIKRFSPLANLVDAELLPAAFCANLLGAGEYLNGCIQLVDAPKYGSARFDPATSDIFYSTTNPNFHGFDKFSYSVITTLSRFSDAVNDRTLTTQVRVVSEPPGSPPSKSLDSGSMGFYSLLMLSLLMLWRRIR